LELFEHLFQPLLEIAAIARARKQRSHVEREYGRRCQYFRHFAVDDAFCNPSAIAVLPTPASPTNSGLFFCRRHSTWMARLISKFRPITGSILPSRAFLLRLTQ